MTKEEDSKMAVEEDKPAAEATKENAAAPAPVPPLIAAGRRLETLLGGGMEDKDTLLHAYINPGKVVRRWLGTASGATKDCTLADIAGAAKGLLDPQGPCAAGVSLILAHGGEATEAMDVEDEAKAEESVTFLTTASAREVETWLISLVARCLMKEQKYSEAMEVTQKGIAMVLDHLETASSKLSKASVSSASLFPLLARLYRYRALIAESINDPALNARLRQDMIRAHNMAILRRDADSQATLLNTMLRDLLLHDQVEQAQKLLSNSTFPDSASNNQLCRFLYNSGRIQALRLEYTRAFSSLSQCLRKAPSNTGLGFRIAAQRLLVVVQLLMGEIPDRQVFATKGMQVELAPYLAITRAVRKGDLKGFTKVVSDNAPRLQMDRTYTLISRLAHQVVKAGLRKLHVSYSRLSLQDVADRLGLPSATSAEFVVAKAVRDGVLDATIHHEEGYVQSHDLVDVYTTKEPAEAFHRRIAYCLTTHNDAVRAMRYPPDEYKKKLEASRGMRRKSSDDKTDEEKAQELEDELEDDY